MANSNCCTGSSYVKDYYVEEDPQKVPQSCIYSCCFGSQSIPKSTSKRIPRFPFAAAEVCRATGNFSTHITLITTAAQPIVHGEIKSSNVLITENLRAKLKTHVFSKQDPEYLKTCQVTKETDIYCFGILLVEIISGRRVIEPKRARKKEAVTVRWVMKQLADGSAVEVLDPKLPLNTAARFALEKIYQLASECIAYTGKTRPTMKVCAEILFNLRKDYINMSSSSSVSSVLH